ncbi:alpha/beta hydrolase fold domain-containing protein [Methanobrevibacter sp.]|uniref:alpha/beta hydrolase fold domain-containing protein n=1 Tax=Methanobrevibacter sp. TaxID=66852 RepID=UPI0026E10C15|nr:alpha/beta hydrolase [Methanobrevibacter sp.]MDO5860629.1 alpha/beta hydrolase [Methanobrevibacter sp.]
MSDKKSLIAKIEEAILRHNKLYFMDSKENVDIFLNKMMNTPTKSPKSIFKSIDFNGMQVFTFGDKDAKNTILYMHGGAYVMEINHQHLLYCYLLSKKLGAYVLAPVYPLAPLHHAIETYELITELYETLVSKDNLILMGDSAGGGFIHSFCQYIKTIDLEQPNNIITFSPWVDVSMCNPPYNSQNDAILGEIGLKEIGKCWAGNLNTQDYRVSPLFGDNTGLADTLIFVGENEIFFTDVKRYVRNLKRDGVNVKLITGPELFHIYPLFPIPEAKRAFKELKNELII